MFILPAIYFMMGLYFLIKEAIRNNWPITFIMGFGMTLLVFNQILKSGQIDSFDVAILVERIIMLLF